MAVEKLSDEHYHKLEVMYQQLESKAKVLADLGNDIMKCCELGDIEREVQDSDAIATKIIEYKARIESVKRPVQTTEIVRPVVSDSSEPISTVTRPRLPRLTLLTFKGDVTRWTSFWDSYNSAIHSNSQLTTIDKFNYSHSLVEGPAARSIKGLTLTEANYESAVDLLKQRYGKPQQIIAAHMDELLKIPNCTTDKPQMLRLVYDQLNVHIRGLAALSVNPEQYGSLLIPMITSKLLGDVQLRKAREMKDEVWKIGDLLGVIKQEVEVREACEGTKLKPHLRPNTTPNTNHSTAGTFVTNGVGIQCVYCKGQHYSASCDKVQDVKARKDILPKSGRCFNCLKDNHKLKECRSPKTCRRCHQRHHQSICSVLSAEAETFIPQSNATNSVTSGTNDMINSTASSNTTNTTEFKGGILLQTAKAIACDVTSQKETCVRILFDCGSQRSYVTESLCSKLDLSPVRSD